MKVPAYHSSTGWQQSILTIFAFCALSCQLGVLFNLGACMQLVHHLGCTAVGKHARSLKLRIGVAGLTAIQTMHRLSTYVAAYKQMQAILSAVSCYSLRYTAFSLKFNSGATICGIQAALVVRRTCRSAKTQAQPACQVSTAARQCRIC